MYLGIGEVGWNRQMTLLDASLHYVTWLLNAYSMHIACTRTVYIVYMYHMCMCTLVHMYSGRNKIQKFVGHFCRLLIAVLLKMYSKFGQRKWILLVGQISKMVRKWPIANCYFCHYMHVCTSVYIHVTHDSVMSTLTTSHVTNQHSLWSVFMFKVHYGRYGRWELYPRMHQKPN